MNILNEETTDSSTFIITFYFTIHIPKTLIKNQATTEKCRPATFTPTIRSVEKWYLRSCVRVIYQDVADYNLTGYQFSCEH